MYVYGIYKRRAQAPCYFYMTRVFFSAKAKQLGSPCCCPYNYIPITVLFFLQSIDAYNFLDSVRHTFWEKIGKTVLKWPKPNSEPPTWSPLGNDQNIYSVAVLPLNIETYSTWYLFYMKMSSMTSWITHKLFKSICQAIQGEIRPLPVAIYIT